LRERGIWNDTKKERLKKLDDDVTNGLLQLKKGGIKLLEARKLAVKIRSDRWERNALLIDRNRYDNETAESQADNARFHFLIAECVLDEDGNHVFNNADDYISKSEEQYAQDAAEAVGEIVYELDPRWRHSLPENKFLKQYNFVDEDLRLVDEEGNLVDIDFKHINDRAELVNDNGEPINEDGEVIDEDGLPKVETAPFLDENGNPV